MGIAKKDRTFFKYPRYENIKDLMLGTVNKYEDHEAFVIKNKIDKDNITYTTITFKKLLEDIYNFGTALFNLGLKGKRIAVISKNRYEWALTYLTNMFGGCVLVPLDKGLPFDELENCVIRSKADAIVFEDSLLDVIEKIRENGKTELKEYISMDDNKEFKTISSLIEKGESLRKAGKDSFENTEIDDNAVAELTFTSGTSSDSKIVMLSQRNIAMDVSVLQLVEDFRDTDTNLALLPYHHVLGSTSIVFILSYGARTAFPDGLRYIQANMKEYGVSVFIGVPLLIESMYKKVHKELEKKKMVGKVKALRKITNICPKLKRKVFKSVIDAFGGKLRLIISGAAALDPEVWEAFNEMGIIIRQGYGLSECAPVVSGENYKYDRKGSVGFAMPEVDVKVFDKNEQGIGEFGVKGPIVMLGYYENEEANKEAFRDGYFMTGDVGYIDPDGFLFITGRKKSVIVLKNGKNVFPEEIEALVNKLEIVKECMVYGLPKDDDVLLSVKVRLDDEVVKEKYADKSEEELEEMVWNEIKQINKTMPTYKYIKNMDIMKEDFIKTTTAKIKRYKEMERMNIK